MADETKCPKCGRDVFDGRIYKDDLCFEADGKPCLRTQIANLTAKNDRLNGLLIDVSFYLDASLPADSPLRRRVDEVTG